LSTDSPNILYVVSANQSCLEDIFFQIQGHRKENIERKYTVVFIPKINYDCQQYIEKNYLKAELNIQNLQIDMVPLDKDILSLEANETINELFINNDTNILSILARSIAKFETVFGQAKYKYAKGDYAKTLKKLLESEEEDNISETEMSLLATVMLDRSVDYITPMCSQYTYEGLIDEFLGINYNIIRVKPEILEKTEKNDIKIELSSKDKFYTKIRDFNFNHLRSYLPAKLDEHKQILAEGNKQTKDLKALSEILEKIKQVKEESPSIAPHIHIADFISNIIKHPSYIEYLRYEQNLLVGGDLPNFLYEYYDSEQAKRSDITKIARLSCLESLIHNGMRPKLYDSFKRDFLNVYGFQEVFLLRNLEKLKILKKSDGKSNYDYINENLNLIKEDVNIFEPDDASYVFGGFCPIMVRLIEILVKKGWNSIKEVIKKLPGEFDYPQSEKDITNPKNKSQGINSVNFILVVFIGGITYSEISAIRYLNKSLKGIIYLFKQIINSSFLPHTFSTAKNSSTTYDKISTLH
jgi:hypothetical protein